MVWKSVRVVMAMDLFKTQNANVAQSAEALGSLKREWDKRKIVKIQFTNEKCAGSLGQCLQPFMGCFNLPLKCILSPSMLKAFFLPIAT